MSAGIETSNREYDIVVSGASGFTGRLVAEYLYGQYATGGELKWAVAGRNVEKLQRVMQEIGIPAGTVDMLVADSTDADALNAIAARTRVVLTTVGPYAQHGSELVAACVANGTGYVDLAGEVQWMRQMIDTHQKDAEASGARIVHACGFDSIPSDMGVWFLQREAVDRFGKTCAAVSLGVRAIRGGFSGGTAASLLNAIEEGKRDRSIARMMVDPYSLNPDGERDGPDGRDQQGPAYSEALGSWTCPFVMAVINQRVVRRTNALLRYDYGKDFRYSEATMTGPGLGGRLKAISASVAMGAFMAASAVDFTRENIVKRLVPDQGEGPGEKERETGFFNLVLVGRTNADETMRVRVTGDRDPGYGSTSKMIAESAVCLAKDDLSVGGGFWTPASAMNGKLLTRLQANAGLTFDVL